MTSSILPKPYTSVSYRYMLQEPPLLGLVALAKTCPAFWDCSYWASFVLSQKSYIRYPPKPNKATQFPCNIKFPPLLHRLVFTLCDHVVRPKSLSFYHHRHRLLGASVPRRWIFRSHEYLPSIYLPIHSLINKNCSRPSAFKNCPSDDNGYHRFADSDSSRWYLHKL